MKRGKCARCYREGKNGQGLKLYPRIKTPSDVTITCKLDWVCKPCTRSMPEMFGFAFLDMNEALTQVGTWSNQLSDIWNELKEASKCD